MWCWCVAQQLQSGVGPPCYMSGASKTALQQQKCCHPSVQHLVLPLGGLSAPLCYQKRLYTLPSLTSESPSNKHQPTAAQPTVCAAARQYGISHTNALGTAWPPGPQSLFCHTVSFTLPLLGTSETHSSIDGVGKFGYSNQAL